MCGEGGKPPSLTLHKQKAKHRGTLKRGYWFNGGKRQVKVTLDGRFIYKTTSKKKKKTFAKTNGWIQLAE